jgi:hypothetical protein
MCTHWCKLCARRKPRNDKPSSVPQLGAEASSRKASLAHQAPDRGAVRHRRCRTGARTRGDQAHDSGQQRRPHSRAAPSRAPHSLPKMQERPPMLSREGVVCDCCDRRFKSGPATGFANSPAPRVTTTRWNRRRRAKQDEREIASNLAGACAPISGHELDKAPSKSRFSRQIRAISAGLRSRRSVVRIHWGALIHTRAFRGCEMKDSDRDAGSGWATAGLRTMQRRYRSRACRAPLH